MSEIMPILTGIIPLALTGVIAVIVIINVVMGLIGGLKKRLAALVAIVISAILAAIITSIVCSPSSGLVKSVIDKINQSGAEGSFMELGSIGEALLYYVAMMIKPIFFTAVYSVLSTILCIVVSIISKLIPILNGVSGVAKRLGGAGVGVATGLLVALFTLVPVVGTIMVGADVIDAVAAVEAKADDEEDGEADFEDEENVELPSVKDAYKGFKVMGYELLYDSLANERYQGEKVYLRKDVNVIISLINKLGEVGEDLETIDEEKTQEIGEALDELDKSPLIRGVLAGVLSDAADGWLNGENFMGMEKISAGELFDPIIDTMLEIVATTNKDTVVTDIRTVVDMLGVLAKHDMLSGAESDDILEKINDGTIITEMLEVIGENERMYPLADEVTRLGLRTLATALGIPNDADERYDALMDEIASVMNDTYGMSEEDRYTAVADGLEKALSNYGVAAEGEALESVTQGILADLGNNGNVEGADVKEFFALYAAASGDDSSANAANSGLVNLSSSKKDGIVINNDGSITVNGVTLRNYNVDNYRNSAAYTYGVNGVNFDDAATLYSAKSMKSTYITLEEIFEVMTAYGECEDIKAEAEKLGEMFGEFLSMTSDEGFDSSNVTEIFEKIGGVLDDMKESDIFGAEFTGKLLSAIMQSETLVEKLGLSRADLTAIADNINSHALGEEDGFASATGAVASTVDAVKISADTNATKEEKIKSVETMIQNVNTNNADMLTSIITGSVVNGFNSSVGKADTVSDSLSDLINNMAEFKEGNPTDAEVTSEAEAVSQVISLAMTGANDGAIFNTEDSKGSIDATPEEFIGQMINSDVVMKTVNATAEGGDNPYGVNYSSDKEQETVSNALENYYVENGGGDELAEKLESLATVMNVEIDLAK